MYSKLADHHCGRYNLIDSRGNLGKATLWVESWKLIAPSSFSALSGPHLRWIRLPSR